VEVENQLEEIIGTFNQRLNSNKTCGQVAGSYKRQSVNLNGSSDKIDSKVPNSIDLNVFKLNRNLQVQDIDPSETVKQRRNVQNPTILEQDFISRQFEFDLNDKGVRKKNQFDETQWDPPVVTWYVFEGEGRFQNLIDEMKKKVKIVKEQIQDDITFSLSEYLQQQKTLGFVPNVRNVLAIIFANAEAFLRLMDNVHAQAWALNQSEARINAILGNNSVSADKQPNGERIVYPWPQLVEKTEIKDKIIYELKYPGDVTIKEKTQATDYNLWPRG